MNVRNALHYTSTRSQVDEFTTNMRKHWDVPIIASELEEELADDGASVCESNAFLVDVIASAFDHDDLTVAKAASLFDSPELTAAKAEDIAKNDNLSSLKRSKICVEKTRLFSFWVTGGDLATARYYFAGCGTQTAGLSFGGYDGSNIVATTEEYDGAAWSAGGDLATARRHLASCGTQTAGLSFGGYDGSNIVATTEEYW